MLERPHSAIAFELRTAWALHRRVALRLDERCAFERLEGKIKRVSTTDAFIVCEGWHVPIEAILAISNPSRLGDSDIDYVPPVPTCILCGAEAELDRREACGGCSARLAV